MCKYTMFWVVCYAIYIYIYIFAENHNIQPISTAITEIYPFIHITQVFHLAYKWFTY